ncbi:MAG: DNA mismatch repair endonuclease MutL [Roseburia sp.]
MPQIELLNQETIDKIAAGEVVERPNSVVKELVENAIDAGANAITVEIKEGGISLIRISDNGCGIEKDQIRLAFLRHSTSKIKSVEDLLTIDSLGFRGEALSSIAAVSQVELITKTRDSFTGSRYLIEGSKEISLEEIGAPDGTTFLVRNLFYNTPARKKFLKSAQTEGNYIHELMQRMILSHPDISFKFIMNGQVKLQSSGNSNVRDIIYHIYGRDINRELLDFSYENKQYRVTGYIGKPQISRGNRNYEIFYINGRFIRSKLISKAIEDAYKPFMMQHQYPMTVLYFRMDSSLLDVNVHPTKMELRFSDQEALYYSLVEQISDRLRHQEMIPQVPVGAESHEDTSVPAKIPPQEQLPEPFEVNRLAKTRPSIQEKTFSQKNVDTIRSSVSKDTPYQRQYPLQVEEEPVIYEQQSFLDQKSMARQRIIGQLFDTYWLVEFDDQLFIVDQHAAHEKVLYERFCRQFANKEFTSQSISPPVVLSLSMREIEVLNEYQEHFQRLGFDITHFGGNEYSVCGMPDNLYKLDPKAILIEMLDQLTDGGHIKNTPELILDKLATMACKAAVKGNNRLSVPEMEALMQELMQLENPYHCPHGRPTIISMSKYEIEKKFKRIV